jgi:hypothetical protein
LTVDLDAGPPELGDYRIVQELVRDHHELQFLELEQLAEAPTGDFLIPLEKERSELCQLRHVGEVLVAQVELVQLEPLERRRVGQKREVLSVDLVPGRVPTKGIVLFERISLWRLRIWAT